MPITLSLAEAEDKALALFSGTGAAVLAEQYLAGSPDPHYQAVGQLLVAIGVFLKAVIASAPPTTPATATPPK
jgi:hypothetical protein